MKFHAFSKTVAALALSLSVQVHAEAPLTDAQALAEGMTPIELVGQKGITANNPLKHEIEAVIQQNQLVISINKRASGPGAQMMTVYENGVEILKSKISTGREQRENSTSGRTYLSTTPKGFFRPTKVYKDYLSYTWNAPMPNAVFFIGGIAIHAAAKSAYSSLGKRASGGCIRTTLEDSLLVRQKVMDSGKGSLAGMFKVIAEAKGRNIITNNTVSVPQVSRSTGVHQKTSIQSWDTVIIVHDQEGI